MMAPYRPVVPPRRRSASAPPPAAPASVPSCRASSAPDTSQAPRRELLRRWTGFCGSASFRETQLVVRQLCSTRRRKRRPWRRDGTGMCGVWSCVTFQTDRAGGRVRFDVADADVPADDAEGVGDAGALAGEADVRLAAGVFEDFGVGPG